MNIAELKNEKTVASLAKRLFKRSSKTRGDTSEREMEAALLRLNPHLKNIAGLEPGTPILVPENFTLNANESDDPRADLARELVRESAVSLKALRGALRTAGAEANEQSGRVQSWLKSEQAKRMSERAPRVKEAFASAAAAAATAAKERTAELGAEDKALRKVEASLADFLKSPRSPLVKRDADPPAKPSKRPPRPRRKKA
jgi:hypothetical protein